ncbi:MAG TPA: ABC transporter substrate-binding protein [Acidimicrobiales bacterium]|nr:ABC transporter substrate-binding protein [Acidimicrobiales bacterium]
MLAVVAVASGCSTTETRPTIAIGSLYPRSGAQGVGGTEEARGAQLAVEWANGHGGVDGRRIKVVTADAPRAEAVPSAMAKLRRDGVSVVIGSHGSAISAAAAEAATEERMSFWETGAVGLIGRDVDGGQNFFRLAPMGANLGQAAIVFVRDQLAGHLPARPLRYAVAHVDDAYGRSVGDGAAAEVGNDPAATLVGSFEYNARNADFGAVAKTIAEAKPDVLFVAAYLDDGVALRRAVRAANVPLLANIGTSSSYCMPSFGEALGDDAVGLFASDKPDAADVRADALSAEGRDALAWVTARYTDRWHEPMSAPALSGFANAYALLVHVLPAAKSLHANDVAAAAFRVKLPAGTLANGAGLDIAEPGAPNAGANRRAESVIWEWVAPRTRAVVWPPAYATHPIVAPPIVAPPIGG